MATKPLTPGSDLEPLALAFAAWCQAPDGSYPLQARCGCPEKVWHQETLEGGSWWDRPCSPECQAVPHSPNCICGGRGWTPVTDRDRIEEAIEAKGGSVTYDSCPEFPGAYCHVQLRPGSGETMRKEGLRGRHALLVACCRAAGLMGDRSGSSVNYEGQVYYSPQTNRLVQTRGLHDDYWICSPFCVYYGDVRRNSNEQPLSFEFINQCIPIGALDESPYLEFRGGIVNSWRVRGADVLA